MVVEITRFSVETPTRAPTGATNAYLFEIDEPLLVDPAARTDALDNAADRAAHLAVTHTHPDHVGAVAEYASECTVWALAGHEPRFREATGIEPDRTFAGGDSIAGVGVLETPGHAPDHVAFARDGAVVCGDLTMADGSVAVGGKGADMRAYLDSLRRVHDRDFDHLYPGHGPAIEESRERLDRLIDHRLERERQILDAVEAGNETVEELLDTAYGKDLSGVRDLAGATVRAHLDKLAGEGHLTWDGERARL